MSDFTASDFAALSDVSRERLSDIAHWYEQLQRWNGRINLVSPKALDDFWRRHALDSWQITAYLPNKPVKVLDFGSGAGFPGLAIAIYLKHHPTFAAGSHVTLVESAGKKANFLKTMVRELQLPVSVWADRAEKLPTADYDVITARAFAPMPKLLSYAHRFWAKDSLGMFLKGQTVQQELTEAAKSWTYQLRTLPSLSDDSGHIVLMQDLAARGFGS